MNRKQRNARKMARRRGECIAPVVLVDTQANKNRDRFCLMAAINAAVNQAVFRGDGVRSVTYETERP